VRIAAQAGKMPIQPKPPILTALLKPADVQNKKGAPKGASQWQGIVEWAKGLAEPPKPFIAGQPTAPKSETKLLTSKPIELPPTTAASRENTAALDASSGKAIKPPPVSVQITPPLPSISIVEPRKSTNGLSKLELSRGTASYTVDIEVMFDSTITQGTNRVMVELRQGEPGASRVFDTKYFEGRTATVSFMHMPAGSFFIAIGNGDLVAVGPVRRFSDGQRIHTRISVTQSSGNIGTRSRRSL
jgi:hypothetical protein